MVEQKVKLLTKIGQKGQVVIPKPIRKIYGIKENSQVVMVLTKEGVLLKAPKSCEKIIMELKKRSEALRKKYKIKVREGEFKKLYLEKEFE